MLTGLCIQGVVSSRQEEEDHYAMSLLQAREALWRVLESVPALLPIWRPAQAEESRW